MVKITSKIVWKSDFYQDNLDSICVIDKQYTGTNTVLVTAKTSGTIYEFDLTNGNQIGKWVCSDDSCSIKMKRPNGIANWKSWVGIVERDG